MFIIKITGGGIDYDFELRASEDLKKVLKDLIRLRLTQACRKDRLEAGALETLPSISSKRVLQDNRSIFCMSDTGKVEISAETRIPGQGLTERIVNVALLSALFASKQGYSTVLPQNIHTACKTHGFYRPKRIATILRESGRDYFTIRKLANGRLECALTHLGYMAAGDLLVKIAEV